MKQFSGLDLCIWVRKYGSLLKTSRITQIYRQGISQLCFALNTLEGKRFLIVLPPNGLIFSEKKPTADHKETGFGKWMRNNIKGAIIQDVQQIASERILALKLQRGTMYIELFNKGNIVVCDEKNTIQITLQKINVGGRFIANGEKYELPSGGFDFFHATKDMLTEHITAHSSDKNIDLRDFNVSKFFAMKCNLGGAIAKKVCEQLGIDVSVPVETLLGKEEDLLHIISGLINQEKDFKEYETELFEGEKKGAHDRFEKKLKKINAILTQQQKSLDSIHGEIETESLVGEFIYEHFQFFEELHQAYMYAQKNKLEFTQDIVDKLKEKYAVDLAILYKKPELIFEVPTLQKEGGI